MGLLKEDIEAMQKGSSSELSIIHISNPETLINLSLSLNGFTAAFDVIKPF
jgi:invasion protein IalB